MTHAALKDRDPNKPNTEQGLFRKFDVFRTDLSDQPGGKHHGCEYFVLDLTHDPHAKAALAAYAVAVNKTHPQLAADLCQRYDLSAMEGEAVAAGYKFYCVPGEEIQGPDIGGVVNDALESGYVEEGADLEIEEWTATARFTIKADPDANYTAPPPQQAADRAQDGVRGSPLSASLPDRIWLQVDTDADPEDTDEPFTGDLNDLSWCAEEIGGLEVEYVRADLATQPQQAGGDAMDAALIDAANLYADKYDVDDHADILNAFYRGAAWASRYATPPQPEAGGGVTEAMDAIYQKFCAYDNQDTPLERYPQGAVEALAMAGWAVVPCSLPVELLGKAAIDGVFETGNPKHGWDYLIARSRIYPTTPASGGEHG